jgi:RimJ/RimL family protein N-acetyltransferase
MDATAVGPAYQIHTERLIIRCWKPEDAPLLKETIDKNLDHLRPWMEWANDEPEPLQKKIDRLREFRGKFDLGQDFFYGIFNLMENEVLGATGLHTRLGKNMREIGYWIDRDHIQRGFATEAASALVKVAFEIDDVLRVEIHCAPTNERSAAIPKRLGFRHKGTFQNENRNGEKQDEMVWTLAAEAYPGSPAYSVSIEAYDVMGRRLL